MRTRRAVSLVELLVIMSTCTVVLTLTGVLLQRAMRIQMQSRAVVQAERTALRLADQFRSDVHDARSVDVIDADENQDAFFRLKLSGGRNVAYSQLEGVILRLESGNELPVRREEFVVPAVNKTTIQEKDAPQRLVLTVASKPVEQRSAEDKSLASPFAARMNVHVDAVIGQNLRFGGARSALEASK